MIRRHKTAFAIVLMAASCSIGCSPKKPEAKAKIKPAKLEAHPTEKDIYRITLTPKAEDRLQISTVAAKMQPVPRRRLLGGVVTIPDGQRIAVVAPLAGQLSQIDESPVVAGKTVKASQPLFKLTPVLPPERSVPNAPERMQMANAVAALATSQIQADGDVKQAKAQVEGTRIAFERAKRLLADKAGSRRQVDDTEAAYNIAKQRLQAATQRKEMLEKLTLESQSNDVQILTIRAPSDGIVQTISARTGLVVNSGAALCEIVNLNQVWIRVPVYAGLVNELDLASDVQLERLNPGSEPISAKPVAAPPTADAISASVDLYYTVDNQSARLRPGERVMMRVALTGETESLVVPRAAILRDIHGTAWIYLKTGEHEFRRHRVFVSFTTNELAVLSRGPDVGADVVVDGAAELFGTEFGAGK